MHWRYVLPLGILALLLCVVSFEMHRSLVSDWNKAVADWERNSVVEHYVPEEATFSVPLAEQATTAPSVISTTFHELPLAKSLPLPPAVRAPVLMYHYVRPITPNLTKTQRLLSITPESFTAQMQEITALGYHTITPDDLYAALTGGKQLPDKPLIVTFDDGYVGQYQYAFPVLKQLGLKATFFVITDFHRDKSAYMTDSMLLDMDASGLCTIASHTRHHAWLTNYRPAVQQDEIAGSKQELEKLLGHPVTAFAYPYGKFDASVEKLVAQAGYETAFSTRLGSVHTSSTLLELRRIRAKNGEKLGPLLERITY